MGLIFNRGSSTECGQHHFGDKNMQNEIKIEHDVFINTIRLKRRYRQKCQHEYCTETKTGWETVKRQSLEARLEESFVTISSSKVFDGIEEAIIDEFEDVGEILDEKIEEARETDEE